jgi:hypothetical protein
MALRVAVASGNWSNPATWNGGVLPTVGDIVASNNFTVTIDQNINVDLLTNTAQAIVDAVPNMTSPTTPFGIITESTTVSGFEGWKAFDGSSSLEWRPSGQQWVAYEFPTPKAINQYYFTGDTTKNSWKFEAWDGTNWITLHTITGASTTAYTSPLLGNSTQYIKYRFFTLDSVGHRFREIDFYEYLGTSSAVAGGGFVVTGNGITITCTSTLTNTSYSGTLLTINSTGTVNVNLNYSAFNILNDSILISITNTGTVNFTGNLYGGGNNGQMNISGACTLNYVGNVRQFSNGTSRSTIIVSALNYVLNFTGDIGFTSGGQTGACVSINNIGTINVTGSITGSGTTNQSGIGLGNTASILNVTGTLVGGGIASAISGTGVSYIRVIGSIISQGSSGISSTNTSAINLFSGPFVCSTYGFFPYQVVRMHLIPTTSSYIEFRDETTNGALSPGAIAPATQLVSPATLISNLATSDVRFGVVYALGTLTGTLRMPTANQVTFGVAVDNTFGASVLTAASIWDYLVSNITVENSIGMRLKNVSTPQTTGEQLEAFLFLSVDKKLYL